MATVRQITKEQFVERKGGWTTFYNEQGTICKLRNKQVQVVGEEESARVAKPKTEAAPKKRRGRVTEAAEDRDADEDEETGVKLRRVGNTRHDCSHYVKAKSSTGNKTLDSGDALAVELRGMELDDVYAKAAKALGVTEASLRLKYKPLNPGMQRMNLGNRMRAAAKKLKTINDPKNA